MAQLDLDARRAARREAAQEGPQFTFAGETFTLPVEMPLAALDVVSGVDADALTPQEAVQMFVPLMRGLLGKADWQRFTALEPSIEDMVDLAEWAWTEYGLDPQKPSQSTPPARATGARSKRTSKRTTGSTPARSGAKAG